MKDISKILRALERSSASDVERARYLELAKALNTECGCALGGVFALVSSLATLAYFIIVTGWPWTAVPMGIGFVLMSAFVGKMLGIAIAKIRLLNLFRYLSREA